MKAVNIIKYPGSKSRIAQWICSFMPKHKVYLEPFFGGGAVFFAKDSAAIETINDIDEDVINFFQVLRDYPDELTRQLAFTPYHRKEYDNAYSPAFTPIERARRFAIKCCMGFGCGNLYHNGFRRSVKSNGPDPAGIWNDLPKRLMSVVERLKRAQIECGPALPLIQKYDTPDALIYLDPPYYQGIRKPYLYKYEMSNRDHEEMIEIVKELKYAKVILSGYECELYNNQLKDWYVERTVNQVECGLKRQECLWMNFKPETLLYEN